MCVWGSPINHKVKVKVSSSFLQMIWTPPLQKTPTFPSCVLGSLELLEFVPGGGCGGGVLTAGFARREALGSTTTSHLPLPKPGCGTLLVGIYSLSIKDFPDGNAAALSGPKHAGFPSQGTHSTSRASQERWGCCSSLRHS